MYTYIITDYFLRRLKHIQKKYRDIHDDIAVTLEHFDPRHETHLGDGVYKIRLDAHSLHKGKRNSFRLIVLLIRAKNTLVPFDIYYKGDQESIADKKIKKGIHKIQKELIT